MTQPIEGAGGSAKRKTQDPLFVYRKAIKGRSSDKELPIWITKYTIISKLIKEEIMEKIRKGAHAHFARLPSSISPRWEQEIEKIIKRIVQINKHDIKWIVRRIGLLSDLYYNCEVDRSIKAGIDPKPESVPTQEEEAAESIWLMSLAVIRPNKN